MKEEKAKTRINPEVEIDGRAHLKQRLETDKKLKQIWEADKPKRELGLQVLRRRSELGLSQRDLARRMGTSQSQIHSIESGNANPTMNTLQHLAEALRESLHVDLLEGSDEVSGSGTIQAATGEAPKIVAERLAEAARESYQAVADRAVETQESNIELTQSFFEGVFAELKDQVAINRATIQTLSEQSQQQGEAAADLYIEFLNSMFSYYRGNVEEAGKAAKLLKSE